MTYLVLARKWRPQGFDDLVGQEPITRILKNSISQRKIAHAYIFSGPRGVGKTSTARILAKALNCEKGPTPSPCGACTFCTSITDGSSVDVMEIDGASNNSVNDIRDLRERVKYAPSGGRYKVYIIDESHMLSDSAFNALLKTLEEPPSHVVFVLATTVPKKIPATVLSRCQHLPFRRISSQKIKERLRKISDSEGINISDPAIEMIARAADGSMRDSLTILDQVSSFSSDIKESEVKDLLGIADFKALSEISMAIIEGNRKRILGIISELLERGTDLKSFTKDLVRFFRDLLVAKVVSKPEDILDISEDEINAIRKILERVSDDQLTLILSEIIKAESDVRGAFSPRLALEMSLIKASFLSILKPVKEAIEGIEAFAAEYRAQSAVDGQQSMVSSEKIDSDTNSSKSSQTQTTDNEHRLTEDSQPSSFVDVPVADVTEAEKDFWKVALKKIEAINHPLACKLSEAKAEIDGDMLTLTFNGGTAIHVDSVKKNLQTIEETVSEILDKKIVIKVDTAKKRTPRKKELREKVLSEPIVKEALELFEGKVIDVKPIENTKNGGEDV